MKKAEREDVLKAVVLKAFASVPVPEESDIFDATPSGVDTGMYKAFLAGKCWQDLTEQNARGIYGGVLSPAAYRYFVQAQLIGDFGKRSIGIPPADAYLSGHAFKERWEPEPFYERIESIFTDEQLDAIALYVFHHAVLRHVDAADAYKSFWSKYSRSAHLFKMPKD